LNASRPWPVVGLTTYLDRAQMGVWDVCAGALPANYFQGVTAAGGIAMLLPPQPVDADIADGGESLFVADQNGGFSKNLGIIDTTAFTLDLVGPLQPEQSQCELTGTGGGRLFGFCPSQTASSLVEIDPQTAVVISSHPLSVSIPSTCSSYAFAFAFWGGDFWLFTACNSNSTVTEYDPVAQTETAVATAPLAIVGAGVSTCAPQ